MKFEDVVQIGALKFQRKSDGGYLGLCPAHRDTTPSFKVDRAPDGELLVKCYAGCDGNAVLKSLRALLPSDRLNSGAEFIKTAEYVYEDYKGLPRLRVIRMEAGTKKKFSQEHWKDGKWNWGKGEGDIAPLNYSFWKDATEIFLVEGEKCVEAMQKAGFIATSTPGGAQGWNEGYCRAFADKKVTILPDNDEPGMKFADKARESMAMHADSIRIVDLPGLEPAEDVVDFLAKYGVGKLREVLDGVKTPDPAELEGFAPAASRLQAVEAVQTENRENLIPFGIRFFDEAMGGIMPTDLVVATAKTGMGKTQLAMNVALNAILKGKKVFFFALEAFEGEIEARLTYTLAAHWYIEESGAIYMSFGDWIRGRPETVQALAPYIERARKELAKELAGLFTFYREGSKKFDVTDFERKFAIVSKSADLVIVDHLNYFDSHDDKASDVKMNADVMKRIRDCVLIQKKPVMLLVHVKKGSTNDGALLPDIEYIAGASDIFRIPTKVIIMGKARDATPTGKSKQPTYVRIPKDRFGDNLSAYTALMHFDFSRGKFDDEYMLGYTEKGDKEFVEFDHVDYPHWYGRLWKNKTVKRTEPDYEF